MYFCQTGELCMDLFNLLKKHPAESDVPRTNLEDHAANNNRRFYYMVEDRFALKSGKEVVVVGKVHGTICVEDAIYILQPHGVTTVSIVKGMEKYVDKQPQRIESAADETVSLLLEMKKEDIEPFSIITSIRPQLQIDVNKAVENPIVAGLLYEARDFGKNVDYFQWLIYAVAHGHYLLPTIMSEKPEPDSNGKVVLKEGTSIQFATLSDPHQAEGYLIPVFTDWTELNKWKPAQENGNTDTMIVRFPDAVALSQNPKCGGFVINPFSENQLWVDQEMIRHVTSMEGYQNEFVKKASSAGVEEVHIKKDTPVKIGVPAETDEVKMIRDELATYGKLHENVQEIALLLQMNEEGHRSYIVWVDTESAKAKDHFEKIYETIHGCASQITDILFIIKGQIPSYDAVINENPQSYAYQREG